MKVVHTDRHLAHDPKTFIHWGRLVDSPERPARADMLLAAARASGHGIITAAPTSAAALARVHTARHLDFLEHGFAQWRKLPHAGDEIVLNTHPNRFALHQPHCRARRFLPSRHGLLRARRKSFGFPRGDRWLNASFRRAVRSR